MTLDELRATLVEWLNRVKHWYDSSGQDWNDYILTDEQWMKYRWPNGRPADWPADRPQLRPRDDCLHLILYTNTHRYHISARLRGDGIPYLGCTASTRTPRAGENWTRGSDLPDGNFSWETFVTIMLGIAAYELVAKAKSAGPKPDMSPPTGTRPLIEKVVPKDK